ncbi:ABC transporter substrate-binding protein [Marinobacter sp. AL4B]|uniref:ABC transporter substrate-binding protein n=1 Tax=Marinobacter sp. AL4B TaxID=2871173 RepID=UPI0021CD554E|nr:ABC transporter substrate-binding protein [Marinobacter sp. AL4B]
MNVKFILNLVAIFCLWAAWPINVLSQADHRRVQPVTVIGSGKQTLDSYFIGLIEDRVSPNFELNLLSPSADLGTLPTGPVITIGPKAFDRLYRVKRDAPILATLVELQFLEKYPHETSGKISAILYDVPILRQALTGKVILPHATKVAVLASPHNRSLYTSLLERLPEYGLEGQVFLVNKPEQLISTLIRALNYGDLLLGTPDPDIYHPRNIKHILLTAYRRNKILIGPSLAYVKAGSLASSYPTYSSMADKIAEFLTNYQENGEFPPASYPETFSVEVNRQVARSLNIPLNQPEHIANRIDELLLNPSEEELDD